MKTNYKLFLSAIAAAALSACGGGDAVVNTVSTAGGGVAAVTSESIASTPSPNDKPTAVLVASQATADDLSTEVAAGLEAAPAAASGASQTPSAQSENEKPSAVVSTACQGGGTSEYDLGDTSTAAVTGPAGEGRAIKAGTTYTYTYKKCVYSGGTGTSAYSTTFDGGYEWKYARYNSATDYAYTWKYNNFTYTTNYGGKTNTYTFKGGQSCDIKDKTYNCFYSDGTRGWSSKVTYADGKLNGTYAWGYNGKTVKITYTDYSATSGSVLVEGYTDANGKTTSYKMVRTSATAYIWTYTSADGTKTEYRYPK
jgi:hypothetical protein